MTDLPEVLKDFDQEEIDTPIGSIKVKFFGIDDRNIHAEMDRQPEDLVYFSSFEAAAEKEVAQVKQEIEERKAEIWSQHTRENKLRIKDIEALIEQDPEIQELKRTLIEYEYQLKQLRLARQAVQEKGKMIQSKVGLRRSEITESIEMSRSSNALKKEEQKNA